jgi:hypothetical protein
MMLSHTLDKVRYFRNLLVSEDRRVRILITGPTTDLIHTLDLAIRDMKDVPINQLAILREYVAPRLTEAKKMANRDPILVYVRRFHDNFVNALMEEYGDCEVIVFERDPMLD